MAAILFVRIKSDLDVEEFEHRLIERRNVRPEAYEVLYPLWPERGPFPELDRTADAPR